MAKSAISVTVDEKLIQQLKYLAGVDNRSLSNLTELILKGYVDVRLKENKITQSYEKAKAIASNMRVIHYSEVNSDLMENVSLSEADKKFLAILKGN